MHIAGVTYRNIELPNITSWGIDFQQDYLNGRPAGEQTNGVITKNITMDNIHGRVTGKAKEYYILCGDGSYLGFTSTISTFTEGKNSSGNFHPDGYSNAERRGGEGKRGA
ncbi:hypothetical protein PMIN03_003720 [Paraphaeosphaeria minitans]